MVNSYNFKEEAKLKINEFKPNFDLMTLGAMNMKLSSFHSPLIMFSPFTL